MDNIPTDTRWVRLPKAGRSCPYSGLSRASLYLLAKRGDVESRKIFPTGGSRGVLLIKHASLMSFVEMQVSAADIVNLPHQQSGIITDKAASKPQEE